MEENLLTTGDYRKKILGFMWPILVGQFFQQMYNTADALIVGNFLNAESLAAVTSTSSLVFLIIGFCLGFSSGAGVIVSRHIGARDDEQTGKAVHTAVLLGLVIGIITTILGVFFADDLLRLMGTRPISLRGLRCICASISAAVSRSSCTTCLSASCRRPATVSIRCIIW